MKRSIFAIAAAAVLLIACDQIDTETPDVYSAGDILVLNNGNWGGNDACITVYDMQSGNTGAKAFHKANGQHLGDLGQDILADGEDIYIAVNGSQVIFLTDKDLKIKKSIIATADGNTLSPRCLTKGEEKIYVTYYEGYLGEIDPSDDYSVKTVKVGANPDGVDYAGGMLYTANSGGMNYPDYDNTVSVVDADTFTVTSTIQVNTNPAKILAAPSHGHVYVTSFGNYEDIPAKLQSIDIATGTVTDLEIDSVSSAALGPDEKLYVLCGGYDQMRNPLPGSVHVYRNGEFKQFTDATFPDAYSISVTNDGYVYVGCSDYTNTGDVYAITPSGTIHEKFDSQGLNPIKVIKK